MRERVKALFNAKDKAGQFLRETLAPTLVYTARVTPTIAHSIDDVDRVMQWGFAWELGPFELMDAIGVREVWEAAQATGGHAVEGGVPPLMQEAIDAGRQFVPARQAGAGGGTGSLDPARRSRRESRSCGRTPAPASSISVMACSRSSSTRR